MFALWALTIFVFLKLARTIPIHFTAPGEVDNYGNKIIIIILSTLATIVYAGLSFLNKFPHHFNYIRKITVGNALHQYTLAREYCDF